MPQLKVYAEQIEHFILPSTEPKPAEEQAWVELDIGEFSTKDVLALSGDSKHLIYIQAEMLTQRIKDWNYTEADGSKTPIDIDSVGRLEPEDFSFLVKIMNAAKSSQDTEEKKTLLSN